MPAEGLRLFAVLSGGHPTLPRAEVQAILEAEGLPYTMLGEKPCLLRFKGPWKALEAIRFRAAYTRLCGVELFTCEAQPAEILKKCREASFEELVQPGGSFAVRVRRICGAEKFKEALMLEREIGAIIWRRIPGLKVDLRSPSKLFLGLKLKDGSFLFGFSSWKVSTKEFSARKPSRKPFSHPSTLQPKLARCMVNLSRVKRGGLLFDPFCGTGTILVEAGLMGVETLGGDLQERMVAGARLNLKYYKVERCHLMVADALCPPLRKVDAVATDPPYGRSASTVGRPLKGLLEGFLSAAAELLPRHGCLCMASPLEAEVSFMAEKVGFKVLEEHAIHVHKSLTRLVSVLKLG